MFSQRVSLIALAIIMSALVLSAQTGSGTVQGVVKDVSSAVIVGANVTIVHTATGVKFSTTTNEVGFFQFPPTLPGPYKITVGAPGMQTWEGEFLLQVGQRASLSPVLSVGSATQVVSVVGEAVPLVSTSDAVISTNLERARIEQLPQDWRSIAMLAIISTPGLFIGQDNGTVNGGPTNPIVNGLRDAVELYQDGAVIKNRDVGDFAGRLPGVDSLQEMRVDTSLSSAKADRPGSMILSTKSGTNAIHGSLFETVRNSGLGLARRRQDYYTKAPHYVRNEFGGAVGGPVFIPKVYNGRDRTFFFTTYEVDRILSNSTTSTTMPTMAMRQGDFSGLIDSLGRKTTIYDPLTTGAGPTWARTPFVNNQISATRENDMSKYLYSLMPAPTNDANPLIATNYFGLGWNTTKDWMSTTRIDHRLSDKDLIFGRLTLTQTILAYSNGVPSMAPAKNALNSVYGSYKDQNGALNWSHSFSPSFLSETLVSVHREDKYVGWPPVEGITNMADKLGMPNPLNNKTLSFSTSGMGFMNYGVQQVRANITDIMVIDQNFTRIRGPHEIQFGGKFHYEWLWVLIDQPGITPTYQSQFSSLFDPSSGSAYSAVPQTGHGVASFFLGATSQYQLTNKRPPYNLRDRFFSAYIQDNWKVSPNLTLNLGLRYLNLPAMKERDYLMTSFDPQNRAVVLGRTLDDFYKLNAAKPNIIAQYQATGIKFETWRDAGLPQTLQADHHWIFQPRLGFAYRIGQSQKPITLRGGWGLYDSQAALRNWDNQVGSMVPFGYSTTFNQNDQTLAAVGLGDGLPNYSLRSTPLYYAGVNNRNILDNPAFVRINRGQGIEWINRDLNKPPSAQEWNVSVGREIFAQIVGTAGYVGTHGYNLPQLYNMNSGPNDYVWYVRTGLPVPTGEYSSVARNPYDNTTYGSVISYQMTGFSNYNSFQFQAQRRFSGGYGFQFFYVLSNAMTSSTKVGNLAGATIIPETSYVPGLVPTDFDALHRYLYYLRDVKIPKHILRWNWVVELPFGRGKPLGRNASRLLNGVIGGWQIAGTGSYNSNYWSLPTSNYGSLGNVEIYGTKYPIQNCSSGPCIPGYLYWNGYISPPLINRTNAAGDCTGICGIPANYSPSNIPLIPYGTTTLPANAPSNTNISAYWETQNVWVKLNDNSVVRTAYNPGLHTWHDQFKPGPWTFNLNASLFKNFPLTEAVALRFNADFFQVLNNPGLGTPGSNGILSTQNSSNSPRALQLLVRLSW